MRKRPDGKPGMELIEEAVHLLRRAPGSVLFAYFLGTVPFLLALLYFSAGMARSPMGARVLLEQALGMAVLFVWMKCWHTVFARGLLAWYCREPAKPWSAKSVLRMVLLHAAVQPWGLVLLPLASLAMLPFGWAVAYYQNVSILAGEPWERPADVLKPAWRLGLLWWRQNHVILLVVFLFSLFVFLNIAVMGFLAPQLLKILLGWETMFTRASYHLLNTTFLTGVFALTFLCIDPILKTCYLLRYFYGRSQKTGEDLRVDLRRLRKRAISGMAWTALLGVALLGLVRAPLHAGQAAPDRPAPMAGAEPAETRGVPLADGPTAVDPTRLGREIEGVIGQREYAWRMPRSASDSEETIVGKFIRDVFSYLWEGLVSVFSHVMDAIRWLLGLDDNQGATGEGIRLIDLISGENFALLIVLLAVITFLVLGIRLWRQKRKIQAATATPVLVTPDLTKDEVMATDLPEDEWLNLAEDLLRQGDRRLAQRAIYLSLLAFLETRELISVSLYKTNREYLHELNRRAHHLTGVTDLFGDNVLRFERAWYGMYEVTEEGLDAFRDNQERIRTLAEA